MEKVKDYKELELWKSARILVRVIYTSTETFPEKEKFSITSQINRAAVSIISNIAESQGRNSAKDALRILYIAKGSLFELETQLFLSLDLMYISTENFEKSMEQLIQVRKLLLGFIKHYENKVIL